MSESSSVDAPAIAGFPAGVDPESYRREEVQHLLEQAAYLSIFSVPDASSPNVPVRLLPGLDITTIAVRVHETLHRFAIDVESAGAGLTARNRIGEPMANVEIRWTPMPDDFEAAPGRVPPPTLLNPFRSQRFCMLDGHLQFADAAASSLRAFGTGRTFPAASGGRPRLDIGAVIDVLSGEGKLAGLCGTICVNGTIEPPDGLALNLMLRVMDPQGVLTAPAPPAGGQPAGVAAAESVFLAFLGEVDPRAPVVLRRAPDGTILGSQVHELLRRVSLDSSLDAASGLGGSLVPDPSSAGWRRSFTSILSPRSRSLPSAPPTGCSPSSTKAARSSARCAPTWSRGAPSRPRSPGRRRRSSASAASARSSAAPGCSRGPAG